jgi:multidrug efflux system membrane fusion protein
MRMSDVKLKGSGALIALGLAAFALAGCDRAEIKTEAAPLPVRVEPVKLGSADDLARYAAVIRPRIEADMGFRIGGKIVQRLVDVGDRVEAGTPLAKLDPIDVDLQARAADSQLASARADAANARSDFERYAKLRQGEWTTQQEYDKRRAAMETTEAKVRELEAQLKVARNSAQYTSLVADSAGVVTAVLAEPGQVVAQGQAVFKVARLGEMEAVANVPEQQVALLSKAKMTVELWSQPGLAIAGHLRELSPSADPNTRTYQVKISLIDPPPSVQLGMTATLVTNQQRDGAVALLPMTALTKTGSDPAVWVLDGSGTGVQLRPIQVAAYAGDRVVVAGGVKDGEQVVTAGVQKLDPGVKVRVWTEPVR